MLSLIKTLSSNNRIRKHSFITKEILDLSNKLGRQEGTDSIVLVKYFMPGTCFSWYITEIENDGMAFGYTEGFDNEWGYISLIELEEQNIDGIVVERDLYFGTKKISEL